MTISEQVLNILKYVPQARDDDKTLFITYMQKFGMALTPEQIAIFKQMPSMETLRRSRQAIQERGLYPASTEANERRFERYKQMKGGEVYVDVDQAVRHASKTKSGKMEVMPKDSEEYKTAMMLFPN